MSLGDQGSWCPEPSLMQEESPGRTGLELNPGGETNSKNDKSLCETVFAAVVQKEDMSFLGPRTLDPVGEGTSRTFNSSVSVCTCV